MKKNIRNIFSLGLLAAVLFTGNACKDVLERPVQFEVTVAASEEGKLEQVDAHTYRIPLGSELQFFFGGEPDFISLQYNNFNEADAALSFDQLVSMNDNQDNMQLYVSKQKLTLTKTDIHADSLRIRNHAWTDISDLVSWPSKKNETTSTTIDMNDYRGDSVVFAFCYHASGNKQPMFSVSNFAFTYRTIKDGKVFKTLPASSMVWQPFDMEQQDDSLAYVSTNPDEKAMGVWDVSFKNEDKTAFMIRQGVVSKMPNEDWLISAPVYIPRGKDDAIKTVAIKNYYLAITDYQFTFTEAGEYTLTFIATNANYKYEERTTQTFKFIVYE